MHCSEVVATAQYPMSRQFVRGGRGREERKGGGEEDGWRESKERKEERKRMEGDEGRESS